VVYFVSETAQVQLKSGRVKAPASYWSRETMAPMPSNRGLHSSTVQLNLSALYGIGAARRVCVARVRGVLGGVWGV